jgi:hypothetical protein
MEIVRCVDGDGRIFAFEAYYPDRVEIIGAVGQTVVGIGYETKIRAVIEDALLHVFPVGGARILLFLGHRAGLGSTEDNSPDVGDHLGSTEVF